MNELIIEPGVGIGNLKLGMTNRQVDEILQYYVNEYEKGTRYFGFFENAFKIEYDRMGRAKFIEVVSEMKDFFKCMCHGLNIFDTKAIELIPFLNRFSEHEKETSEDTQYIFKNIGLSLWRPSAFSEDALEEDWFKEMSEENQEQELRNFYFRTAAVYANDGSYY